MSPLKTELPKYTLAQELSNSITHGLGTVLTLIFGPFLILKAVNSGNVWAIVSCSIFILSLLLCYTTSCVYHALGRNNGKRVLRILDHDMIYILISGTYTPYMLVSLRPYNVWGLGTGTVAYIMFGFVYVFCIIGVVFNSINIKKYAKLSMICYLMSGWTVVSALPVLWNIITPAGVLLLLSGGIVYTIGAVLYGIGAKKKYFHSLFHVFVLLGALLMFISVYCFVL